MKKTVLLLTLALGFTGVAAAQAADRDEEAPPPRRDRQMQRERDREGDRDLRQQDRDRQSQRELRDQKADRADTRDEARPRLRGRGFGGPPWLAEGARGPGYGPRFARRGPGFDGPGACCPMCQQPPPPRFCPNCGCRLQGPMRDGQGYRFRRGAAERPLAFRGGERLPPPPPRDGFRPNAGRPGDDVEEELDRGGPDLRPERAPAHRPPPPPPPPASDEE